MLPLPLLTWMYYKYICSAYMSKGMYLPLEEAVEIDKILEAKLNEERESKSNLGGEIENLTDHTESFQVPQTESSATALERNEQHTEQVEEALRRIEEVRSYDKTTISVDTNPYYQPELNAPSIIKPDIETEWSAHADEPLDSVNMPIFDDSPRNREPSEDMPLIRRSTSTPSSRFSINLYEEWKNDQNRQVDDEEEEDDA
jgi:hypothetical protein